MSRFVVVVVGCSVPGGREASEESVGEVLCVEGAWCAEMDVVGVTMGPATLASAGRNGDSGRRGCRLANDLRGEALRRGRELFKSKLLWEMPWRHVMMRSFGGCVETLSRLERLVLERMLLGLPIPDASFIEAVSQVSLLRMRFANAQSCRKTLMAPV